MTQTDKAEAVQTIITELKTALEQYHIAALCSAPHAIKVRDDNGRAQLHFARDLIDEFLESDTSQGLSRSSRTE